MLKSIQEDITADDRKRIFQFVAQNKTTDVEHNGQSALFIVQNDTELKFFSNAERRLSIEPEKIVGKYLTIEGNRE